MQHLHFESIPSTQNFLKEKINELRNSSHDSTNILVSCEHQTSGVGRTGNNWLHFPNSLALSCTIAPNEVLTLSTIEFGILAIFFIEKTFQQKIFLKWPNDLMTAQQKKVGGLITHFHDKKTLILGVGINLGPQSSVKMISGENLRYEIDGIAINQEYDLKELALQFYNYVLDSQNRLIANQIINEFQTHCLHLDQLVIIKNEDDEEEFIFKGISSTGAAIVQKKGEVETKEILAGTLTLINGQIQKSL